MKKTILSATLMLFVLVSMAQAKQRDTTTRAIPQNQVFDLDRENQIKTTNTAIYDGKIHPVYATAKGKLYIILTSKETGKEYRRYIKPESALR